MKTIKSKLKQQKEQVATDLFRNETGAIDLASIMVGVIVIGLIGGVIAATVFSVIPWAQDNAAKQQLNSIVSAESAYMGLSSAVPSPLPAGLKSNSFGSSYALETASLLVQSPAKYCVTTSADGQDYTAYSKSTSGKIWFANKNTKSAPFTGTDPNNCLGDVQNGVVVTPNTQPDTGAVVAPAPTYTLIKKWDFTSTLDGWDAGTVNTTASLTTSDAAHGKVARISGSVNSNAIYATNWYSGLTVVGKKYRLTADLYAISNVQYFSMYPSGSTDSSPVPVNTWKTYSVEFTASNTRLFQTTANTKVNNTTTTYYMDNVILEEIT